MKANSRKSNRHSEKEKERHNDKTEELGRLMVKSETKSNVM